MRDTPAMLRELKVVEQRYQAVLQDLDGIPVTEVAERFGVARQTVHRWVAGYRDGGIGGLADRSHAPKAHPWRIGAEVEAEICDLRSSHRRWGPRRLVFEFGKRGHPVSRSTVYRVLVRRRLLEPVPRRRRRDQYRRWERSAAMELWQLDVTASLFLADGRECKVVTGIDDHSRFCVIAAVVVRATARAVCSAFVTAMAEYGIPGEVLSDNGKQFTGRVRQAPPGRGAVRADLPGERHHPAAGQAPVPDHDGEDRATAPDAAAGTAQRARPVRQH
jgi:transposase